MISIVGWIGTAILLLSYLLLNSKYSNWFLRVDALASGILTLYAILIQDLPFIIVNGFITIMLIKKELSGGIK
jgi:hypothetical protein